MLIRGKPKNEECYVCVKEEEKINSLYRMEFYPCYINEDGVWFERTQEIEYLLNIEV